MFQTVTNFMFPKSLKASKYQETDKNNLKSFKSLNDLSDFQKNKEPKSSDNLNSQVRPFSCDLPFIVSDQYDMYDTNIQPTEFFSKKIDFNDSEGSIKIPQPKTVLIKSNQENDQILYTPNMKTSLENFKTDPSNFPISRDSQETLTNKMKDLSKLLPLESSETEDLSLSLERDMSKVKIIENKKSSSWVKKCQPDMDSCSWVKNLSQPIYNKGSFKAFNSKKKIIFSNLILSKVIPKLDLEFDYISTNLDKIQTRYSISFVDKQSRQILIIHINCKDNTRKVSQEELINFVMTGSICVRSFPESQTRFKRLIADSKLLNKINVKLIYPSSEDDICEHKGEKKNFRSVPSESYTQYRKEKNQQDLNNTWIREVLCRSPNEESYFREYSYINNIGRIQYGKSPGKKNELLMIPLFTLSEEEETLPSLRDVSGIHLDFMRKIEQQKNELFSPYLNLNSNDKIYIYTDLHPTIYVLHFKISLHKHSRLEELSDIIENLSKNKNHYKDMVIENVRLSNLDPLTKIFEETGG